jgi:hypothetical protein
MHAKPANEAARAEPEGQPAPKGDPAPQGAGGKYRIKCTHAIDNTFAGWLDYSGPGNWVYLTGSENTPGGMVFQDYYNSGNRYLNPVGTYVGDPRYVGANGGAGDCQAGWNYWARATAVVWNSEGNIAIAGTPAQHLIDYGNGWVYWDSKTDTALNCLRVPA